MLIHPILIEMLKDRCFAMIRKHVECVLKQAAMLSASFVSVLKQAAMLSAVLSVC